jgi:hypothetical protein
MSFLLLHCALSAAMAWYISPVHLAYNPSYSAGTVFFSHKKSANSVFQPAYNSSRTGPLFIVGRNLVCTLAGTNHMLKWMASSELAIKNSSKERKLFKHSMVMENL